MNYGEIKTTDIANGTGVRTSLFVSGCTHHCKGCFNEETWDFNFGKPFTKEVEDEIIESLKPAYVNGLTILGGEPMEIQNQKVLRPFIERVRREFPNKSIWVYSGYLWEELTDEENKRCHSEDTEPILSIIDVLVDGEFKLELKNISLRFRGSSNQRVINVPATRESGSVVLSEFGENDN
ncbi:anaerobic ribonucleoside-triphosphate reductase activating protein [Butyrivibrio sp. ob235]|uniref:anaerobic ribonucleoside-triphosphate reductase activating protein n=1 Tax=unclassified Butyrivibrio TaxID=2639466 RepID=UPI0003B30DA1|nr:MULTISPECIES: anaerobic ribonucleoside-triphosphate reductase activating protein [unclassified Butyrivibrio]SEL65712.1 anaerobic ribonucleoside-triphosphate reductase activating protein [Butyrivibrio sp. ob235]